MPQPKTIRFIFNQFYSYYYNTDKKTRSIHRFYVKFIHIFRLVYLFIAGPIDLKDQNITLSNSRYIQFYYAIFYFKDVQYFRIK